MGSSAGLGSHQPGKPGKVREITYGQATSGNSQVHLLLLLPIIEILFVVYTNLNGCAHMICREIDFALF